MASLALFEWDALLLRHLQPALFDHIKVLRSYLSEEQYFYSFQDSRVIGLVPELSFWLGFCVFEFVTNDSQDVLTRVANCDICYFIEGEAFYNLIQSIKREPFYKKWVLPSCWMGSGKIGNEFIFSSRRPFWIFLEIYFFLKGGSIFFLDFLQAPKSLMVIPLLRLPQRFSLMFWYSHMHP